MAASGSLNEFLGITLPSFQLSKAPSVTVRVRKSVSSSRHQPAKPVVIPKTSEPSYVYESPPVRMLVCPKVPQLLRGKSLTPKRLNKMNSPKLELDFSVTDNREDSVVRKAADVDVVETERYRHSMMMKPEHHLFRVIKQEYAQETKKQSKVLRADVLFSRLLEGMRSLLSSNQSHEQRSIPPFMVIRKKPRSSLRRQIYTPAWVRREQKDRIEAERHLEKILSICFDAVDVEQRGQIPCLNLLHFLHNFGYEIESAVFSEVLEAYLGTTLKGVIFRQRWMALMRNEECEELPRLLEVPKDASLDAPASDFSLPLDSSTKSLLSELQSEVAKANRLLRRFKLWWEHLSKLNRGNMSIKSACVALAAQYNLHYREVLQRVEQLYGRDAQITEARFLALLHPHLLMQTLRNLGEKLFLYWSLGSSMSFEAFVSTVNRKVALSFVVRK